MALNLYREKGTLPRVVADVELSNAAGNVGAEAATELVDLLEEVDHGRGLAADVVIE